MAAGGGAATVAEVDARWKGWLASVRAVADEAQTDLRRRLCEAEAARVDAEAAAARAEADRAEIVAECETCRVVRDCRDGLSYPRRLAAHHGR